MLAGCPRHLPVARPYPAPTAAALADALDTRQRAVASMNARARATSWLGGDRVRATVLMLVDRRGRLRIEAEVSLQGTVAVLATDGQRFAFLDAMKNEMRVGPACPKNVASLIRIPLGPPDVAAILLGDARLPNAARPADGVVDWDKERAADVLAVPRHDGSLRLLFQRVEGAHRLVGALATDAGGRARWRLAFEDFAAVEAAPPPPPPGSAGAAGAAVAAGGAPTPVALPRTIRFAEGEGSFEEGVEIKFKERTLNEPLAADAFSLRPEAGTPVFEVGCPP